MKMKEWFVAGCLALVLLPGAFCRPVRAVDVIPATVAGNVADRDGDGLGDNHNDLPGEGPMLASAGLNATGGPGSNGTMRIQMEWNIGGLVGATFARARVRIFTLRGTVDQLDTSFYHGSREQDGLLRDSDFEAPVEAVCVGVMPVVGAVGETREFVLDVTGLLQSDIDRGRHFFSLQGRVDESLRDAGRGLQVCTTASGNIRKGLQPRLELLQADEAAAGTYSEGDYNYYVPYYSSEAGSWTGLGLANRSRSRAGDLEITVFATNGVVLAQELKNIAAYGQAAFPVAPGLERDGWMRINSHQPLSGLVFFGDNRLTPSLMADIPFVAEPATCLLIPHVAADEYWDTVVMVCNPGPDEATVGISYVDRSGNSRGLSFTLPARGSARYSLAAIFEHLVPLAGRVEITSETGIVAYALYNNRKSGGSYFAGISADRCE